MPLPGLVDSESLKPGDLIGVNKDSFIILDSLPAEYDSRVKAMELDERPSEDYNEIGGLDKQIEELVEAIVLPMTNPERFKTIGIKAPKGTSNLLIIRCSDVWTSRNRKDFISSSMCSTNKGIFFKISGSSACAGTCRL